MSKNAAGLADALDDPPIVIVLDDDPLVRTALDSLFRSVGYKTRTFESARKLLDVELPEGVRCLVSDMRMPGISGFDLQQRLEERGDEIPIVFVTGHGDIPMGVRAMKAGAVDFLVKPFREIEILDAVTSALERDRDRQERRAELGDVRRRYDTLTMRERQLMEHVVTGEMNKQIAGALDLSEQTVKLHRGTMMRKMGVRTVPDLVRLGALLNGR